MKQLLRILAGCACFVFFVVQPLRANLLASIAFQYQMTEQDKSLLLSHASLIDPCEPNILNALGDSYISIKNPIMAAVSHGGAMVCSPGNSSMRFKFGEELLMMGFDGRYSIEDALRLEPNNPVYEQEYRRITELLSRSQ